MAALLIISLSTVLSLQAVENAHAVAAKADEMRRARSLMLALLENGPRSFSPLAGQTLGFSWTLQTQTTGLDRPIAVCRRAVSLQSLTSKRAFATTTYEPCPAEVAA
jgi:hypothetical protein